MKISKLIRVGCVATMVSAIAIGTAPIAVAQTITTPRLSFPQANTGWGCNFFVTCENKEVTSAER